MAKNEDTGLTMQSIRGVGLAAIPGLADVWNHALDQTERVHQDQDRGVLLPDGSVEVTIKITMSRKSIGDTRMDVTHATSLKLPGYVKQGCTAHKHGKDWSFVDAEQQELPGVTRIPARGGKEPN